MHLHKTCASASYLQRRASSDRGRPVLLIVFSMSISNCEVLSPESEFRPLFFSIHFLIFVVGEEVRKKQPTEKPKKSIIIIIIIINIKKLCRRPNKTRGPRLLVYAAYMQLVSESLYTRTLTSCGFSLFHLHRSLYDNNIPTMLNGTFDSLRNIQTLYETR